MSLIEKKRTRDLPQINERIRFPKIRVIDTDGSQLGILTPQEAIQLAEEKELDLVLLSDKAEPPVCRIMDYGKYKFEQEKKAREARKKQHTADVKATVMFRGREIQHSDMAEVLLKRMATDLETLGEVQQAPKKEGRNMMMLISPKK